MKDKSAVSRLISFLLILSFLLSTIASADTLPSLTISDPNEHIEIEDIEIENTITETVLNSIVTEEIYLQEIIVAEELISEYLLEENSINEVVLCSTIYVPQENLQEFCSNSQISELFGGEINLRSLFTKLAVGTGIIITVVVLKKVGLPEPVVSIVASAADEALKFAGGGAAISTLFGASTGATDEIDQSGRTSAIIGFALATAGVIITAVSFVGAIPSGGASGMTTAAGVKLTLKGVTLLTATAGFLKEGYRTVKTFTEADSFDINWDAIDWEEVAVSSAQQAINYGADGYMWGAIAGTIYGGIDGYEYFHKYHTPYTSYTDRLSQLPNENKGHWKGKRGESEFILDQPIEVVRSDGSKITIDRIPYKNAVPDFSLYQEAQVQITKMTNVRKTNFDQADTKLAEMWSETKRLGRTWTRQDVETFRSENHLSWHEMSNMKYMQLVPSDVNQTFTHYGGVAEYNAMLKQDGGLEFD